LARAIYFITAQREKSPKLSKLLLQPKACKPEADLGFAALGLGFV
jgi:hypothetical protein